MAECETIRIAALLSNLSAQTGHLAQTAMRLDDALGDIAASGGTVAGQHIVQLQEMDRLRQTLQALQAVLKNASELIPPDKNAPLAVDRVACGVKLEAVRTACLEGAAQTEHERRVTVGRSASEAPILF